MHFKLCTFNHLILLFHNLLVNSIAEILTLDGSFSMAVSLSNKSGPRTLISSSDHKVGSLVQRNDTCIINSIAKCLIAAQVGWLKARDEGCLIWGIFQMLKMHLFSSRSRHSLFNHETTRKCEMWDLRFAEVGCVKPLWVMCDFSHAVTHRWS